MVDIDRLLTAGLIEPEGDGYKMTKKAKRMLRGGFSGSIPGESKYAIDSVEARSKPKIKKKKKQKR